MKVQTTVILLAGMYFSFPYALGRAQEGDPSEKKEATQQIDSSAEISQLIKDLDGNRFSKRQDASRKLKEMGKPAIEKLTEAVLGESREASSRAFAILDDHFSSDDDALKEAAKGALQKLAQSDKATVARKAQDLLDPKPPPQAPQQPIRIGGGQIQLQFGVGGAQQVQIRNVNGVRSISIKENGRSIKIDEDPNKGIKIEVKEKVDGKEVTKKYEAKDAAELKKKHPEGHKIYEKYNKGGQIQIQRGFPIRGLQMQAVPAARPRLIDPKPVRDQLEKISAQVEEAQKLLEKHQANPDQTDSLEKAIERLKAAREALKETQKKTG